MRGLGVIILAAGQGKRMRSATPKVMHLLGGKPLLSHVLGACAGLEPDRVLVVVGHGAEGIREAFPEMDEAALGAADASNWAPATPPDAPPRPWAISPAMS